MKSVFLVFFAAALTGMAQGLNPSALLKPPTNTWPTYNGDYSGRRYSTLTQINSGNVRSLALAWAFQERAAPLKCTPLEVNGILYFSAPDNVWAVDARTGRDIWHFSIVRRKATISPRAASPCIRAGSISAPPTRI